MTAYQFNLLGIAIAVLWCIDLVLLAELPLHIHNYWAPQRRTYPGCGIVWWIKHKIEMLRIREWEVDNWMLEKLDRDRTKH